MSFKSFLLLFCFAAAVAGLSTHHRAVPAHRALAHRAVHKRCKPRPSGSSLAASSTAHRSSPTTNIQPTTPNLHPTAAKPVITSELHPTTTTNLPAISQLSHTPKPSPSTAVTTKATTMGPSFMTGTQTGAGTFYSTGLGACGIANKDTDYIAAVSHLLFDKYPGYDGTNPNDNPMCGKQVRASYQGKSVVVTLTDRCTGCDTTDLDFSPSAFSQLADFTAGRLFDMTWVWL